MERALVDQDVQPAETLRSTVGDRLDLHVGVESTESALIDRLDNKEVLITTSRLPVTEEVLSASDDLRIIGKIGTGIDNIAIDTANDLGIAVTHTPGLNAASVAELTVGLTLAVSRNIVIGRDLLREGGWRDEAELSSRVNQKTVGIIGFGNIGRRVGSFFSGFNVELLAHDPYAYPEATDVTGAELTSLEDLLSRSDIVTINAELTDETRGLIGERELGLMKDSAILINTARGPIVSESALIGALESDDIAGAGLDVFETEPLPASSPLHEHDNVVVTPHFGATTRESRNLAIRTLVDNIFSLLDGEPVRDRYVAVQGRR